MKKDCEERFVRMFSELFERQILENIMKLKKIFDVENFKFLNNFVEKNDYQK